MRFPWLNGSCSAAFRLAHDSAHDLVVKGFLEGLGRRHDLGRVFVLGLQVGYDFRVGSLP